MAKYIYEILDLMERRLNTIVASDLEEAKHLAKQQFPNTSHTVRSTGAEKKPCCAKCPENDPCSGKGHS